MSYSRGLWDLALTAVFTLVAKKLIGPSKPPSSKPVYETEQHEGYRRGIDLIYELQRTPSKNSYQLCYDSLAEGADITAKMQSQMTALDIAAQRNLMAALRLLTRAAMNPFDVDPHVAKGMLCRAHNFTEERKLQEFLEGKIRILDDFIKSRGRSSQLMHTPKGRDGLRLVELIKAHPRNTDEKEHAAFLSQCADLIKSGADILIGDDHGYSAIEWAAKRNFDSVLYLLVMALEKDKGVSDKEKMAILECANAYDNDKAVHVFLGEKLKVLPRPS